MTSNQVLKIIALTVFLTSASAFAGQNPSENKNSTQALPDQNWTISAVKKKNGLPWGSALIATSENGRQVGFRCWEGTLLAAFALEEDDLLSALTSSSRRQAIRLDVSINGEETEKQNWVMIRRHMVVASGDRKMTRRLYNAAVRGEPVTIDARRRGGEYIMPPPDPEAFASFMEACGFSAKKKQ